MGFDIGEFGQGVASQAAGGALGIVLGGINDDRQYKQQQRLQNLQIQGQEQLTDYNRNSAMAMWRDTNAPAQVKQYEAAGLNPGLMYGGGGAGGTTASISPGNVSGGQAPSGGHEAIEGAQMGLGLQLQQAQIKVLNTQAEKNLADATKTKTVDTEQTKATTELTQQQYDNARQAFDSTKLDITMKNIQNFEQQASQQDRLTTITSNAKEAVNQSEIIANQRKIQDTTLQDQIKIIKQEAIGAVLKNEATKSGIQINDADLKVKANAIMLGWETLSNEQKKTRIQQNIAQGTYKDTDQQYYDNVIKTIDAISIMKGKAGIIANP